MENGCLLGAAMECGIPMLWKTVQDNIVLVINSTKTCSCDSENSELHNYKMIDRSIHSTLWYIDLIQVLDVGRVQGSNSF